MYHFENKAKVRFTSAGLKRTSTQHENGLYHNS